MREGWNVILRHDPAFRTVDVWLIKHNADGSEAVIQPVPLTMTLALQPFEIRPEPTLRFANNDATQFLQGLADGLVEAGFRPDALKATDKEILALKSHLEDMRKLVFEALLPPTLPPPYLERDRRPEGTNEHR